MLSWLGSAANDHFWWVAVMAFVAAIGFETLLPARNGGFPAFRWASNFLLYAACISLTDLVTPSQPIMAGVPPLFGIIQATGGDAAVLIAGILSLDLFGYALHRLEHAVFPLWRFHSVHHSDPEMDASTALRHHPLDYACIAVIVSIVFRLLGLPIWVFAVYGVLLFASALFQHLNVSLPERAERALQLALVCPDMHRVHHSAKPEHYNFNFGSVFSIWDRLFGTYLEVSRQEQDLLTFGLGARIDRWTGVWRPWSLPFTLRRSITEPTLVPFMYDRVRDRSSSARVIAISERRWQ